jgi:hypothetical protein
VFLSSFVVNTDTPEYIDMEVPPSVYLLHMIGRARFQPFEIRKKECEDGRSIS